MLKINDKYGIEIPDTRNIDVMVLTKTKKKDGTVKEEWKLFGHVGRNIKSAIKLLLDANVMHSEVSSLWELAEEQHDFMDNLNVKSIADYELMATIEMQDKRIKELEAKLKDK